MQNISNVPHQDDSQDVLDDLEHIGYVHLDNRNSSAKISPKNHHYAMPRNNWGFASMWFKLQSNKL